MQQINMYVYRAGYVFIIRYFYNPVICLFQIVDQQNTYYNDIYTDKKYDQKRNQQDQQKDVSKHRNSPQVVEHSENGEIRTVQEKNKTRQRKQVMYRHS